MKNYRNNPLISVLVPVYNCADFLDDCITSIVSQDYRPFQLILANDGSTDGSLEICRRYASKYDFIEVLTGPNQGVASTRNKLLDNAIGEYLLFVDADDWIEPGTLSCLYEIISSKNSDIAVCAPKRANSDFKSVVDVWGKEKTIKEFLKHKKISGALWNKLIRRSLIEGERFRKDIFYGEDALFVWKILQRVGSVAVSNLPLYNYRPNMQSLSRQNWTPEKKGTGHFVWAEICKDAESWWPEIVDIAYARYAQEDMWALYFASLCGYKKDSHIRLRQDNIRKHLSSLKKYKLDGFSKYLTAWLLCRCYSLGIIFRIADKYKK